jgi:hypothetical protein
LDEQYRRQLAAMQPFRCRGCGAPVFWIGRGRPGKWCDDCKRRLNRERSLAWRHANPDAWQKIKRDSLQLKQRPTRRFPDRGITRYPTPRSGED